MSSQLDQILSRLNKLEAIQDIRALKIRYAMACDTGYDRDIITEMFTEDAIWDGGEKFGKHAGHLQIGDFFAETGKKIPFAMHFMIGGDVVVADDGVTAEGLWQLWQPTAFREGDTARSMIFAGIYRDEYRLVDGEWLFSSVTLDFTMQVDTSVGWGLERSQL